MSDQFEKLVSQFQQENRLSLLKKIKIGVEKEGLRIRPDGRLSQAPHPKALGSALTHPKITTDYSEAMLEFITEPFEGIEPMLDELEDIHRYCYSNIGEEKVWAASMPCILKEEKEIPLAWYGNSNVGMMKHVYRQGLGRRYGRKMQSITGIHYNFSLPAEFWSLYQELLGNKEDPQDFKSASYFGLIRNFARNSWLVCYLFGASPALCKSFLKSEAQPLESWDQETAYLPYATSLRMSDLGYQSQAQDSIFVCYNQLDTYINTLKSAVETEYPEYRKIGVKVNGEYQQLNCNLLQIENEFYSHVRPKQITRPGERPVDALASRGVEYIEIRLLDINPFLPLGLDAEQSYFLNSFLLNCLLEESPRLSCEEFQQVKKDRHEVLMRGRDPQLLLHPQGKPTKLKEAALQLFPKLQQTAALLDQAWGGEKHQQAVQAQMVKFEDPNLLPSAKILNQMKEKKQSFTQLVLELSKKHHQSLVHGLEGEKLEFHRELAEESLRQQFKIEAEDNINFDEYLADYFSFSSQS
ncbi:MAG: glutamate--cysteine ligase [SAR324 cluster bacterium]|uniref:Glutamate--cysteine ligase n=1 Tax=SAR324 cluster bacterium TaxID=2024889 RepID=A0A2A4T6N4_9DELT|nr:MAG: glutamate--cysteine ligase [SAR324 cluster bacterium]